ncbi:uncharacterized protein MELLADRAFT_87410 [Melampsora larici-populina 98AG31]|uniref:Uncharacterized protein n=1 Tax=Melampsora larici-populina (strain 98AG31 / pathotype 3-4-7) TaxID=747676 RepID=F4RN81_MELLP|nr:uncharacterized protein MELLADRAFT_87410 [Melampsora larici-populina 98AG31]EGG06253.1 hypothetical protein MELLADRAFT_87410 [Melampsora larici-populina 98AG31]
MESSTSTTKDTCSSSLPTTSATTTTTTATPSTGENSIATTTNPPTEPTQTTGVPSTEDKGSSTSTEQEDATITSSEPKTYTEIPPPPREGTFKTVDDVEAHLTAHARANQYEITNLDVRKNLFSTWKCALGPNRKQTRAKKAAEAQGKTLDIPTCPFAMTAKRDPVTNTWYIKIEHNKHNHGPILDMKIDHDTPLVKPKKRKRGENESKSNSNSFHPSNEVKIALSKTDTTSNQIVSAPKEPNKTFSPPLTFSAIPERYHALITNLQELDEATEQRLLAVFVRDCQLAKNITEPAININKQTTTTTAGPSHSQSNSTVETDQEPQIHEQTKDKEERKNEEEENATIDDNDSDDIPTTLLVDKHTPAKTTETQTKNSTKTTSEAPLEQATGTENNKSRPTTRKSTRVTSHSDSIEPPKKKSKKNQKSQHSNPTPPHTGTSTPNETEFPNNENPEVVKEVLKVC